MNSQREAFEEANPRPENVWWSGERGRYVGFSGNLQTTANYQGRWEGWQAATEQGVSVPNEHGKNRYGLDMAYFRNLFNRELNRTLVDFKPSELARVLARASRTADASVLLEPEFQTQQGVGKAVAWHRLVVGVGYIFAYQTEKPNDELSFDQYGWEPLYTHSPKPTGGGVPDLDLIVSWAQGWREYDFEGSIEDRIIYGTARCVRDALLATQKPPEQE